MLKPFSKILFLIAGLMTSTVWANQVSTSNDHQVSIGFGEWSVFDTRSISALHLSYAFEETTQFKLRPVLLAVAAEEERYYFAIGAYKSFYQYNQFSMGFAFHAGHTDHPDLGHKIEFYSVLSADYNILPDLAIRAEFGHISNGGLGTVNPGSESLAISTVYSF